jgi:hypothetical protein
MEERQEAGRVPHPVGQQVVGEGVVEESVHAVSGMGGMEVGEVGSGVGVDCWEHVESAEGRREDLRLKRPRGAGERVGRH